MSASFFESLLLSCGAKSPNLAKLIQDSLISPASTFNSRCTLSGFSGSSVLPSTAHRCNSIRVGIQDVAACACGLRGDWSHSGCCSGTLRRSRLLLSLSLAAVSCTACHSLPAKVPALFTFGLSLPLGALSGASDAFCEGSGHHDNTLCAVKRLGGSGGLLAGARVPAVAPAPCHTVPLFASISIQRLSREALPALPRTKKSRHEHCWRVQVKTGALGIQLRFALNSLLH